MSAAWRRMPTWFPNIRLQMLPLTAEQKQQLLDTGWLREVAFKTEPRVTKLELKAFLESVHGMQVERVSTINYQGKRKRQVDYRGRPHYFRRSDWKKAYVIFKAPPEERAKWEQQQAVQLQEHAEQLQRAARERQRPPSLLPAAAAALAAAAAPAAHAKLAGRQRRRGGSGSSGAGPRQSGASEGGSEGEEPAARGSS